MSAVSQEQPKSGYAVKSELGSKRDLAGRAASGPKRTSDDGHSIYSADPAVLDWLKGTGRSRYGGFPGTFDIREIFGTARFSTFSTASVICRHRWASCPCSPYLESRHRPGCIPADMTQTEFFVARYIAPAGPICFRRTYLRFWPRAPARASTSNPLHGPITNHSKVDPADQIRTVRLGGAHGGHRLSQRTDVRSKRHDSA
jgi:hypothetical protein